LTLTNCISQDFKYSANLSPKSVKPEKTTQNSRKCSLNNTRHLNTSPSTYLKLTTTRIMSTIEFNVKNEIYENTKLCTVFRRIAQLGPERGISAKSDGVPRNCTIFAVWGTGVIERNLFSL
jgi:hypothetical protein